MSKPYAIALMVFFAMAATAADPPGGQTTAATVPVKVSLDKTEPPIPVKIAAHIDFGYCIPKGLRATDEPDRQTTKCTDVKKPLKVGANVDDIVAAFAKNTEFTLQKVDKFHLLLFCVTKEKVCDGEQIARMKAAIESFAKPSPQYYEDVKVDASIAKDLAAAIVNMTKGDVTGKLIGAGLIRLETDKKLEAPVVDTLLNTQIPQATAESLRKVEALPSPVNAKRIPLPFFCIATHLDGDAPAPLGERKACADGTRPAQGSNAADIATALTTDKIKVTADLKTSIIVNCGGSKCDSDAMGQIANSVAAMARTSPAYTQDLAVLPQTARSAAEKLAKWSNGAIAADVLSDNLIRLKSDTKVPRADFEIFRNRLLDDGFGDSARLPTKQLFYADAGDVVASLYGSAPVASPLAPGTTPPDTTGSSSGGAASAAGSAPAAASATPAPAAATSLAPAPAPATLAARMTAVGDTVVLSGIDPAADSQRVRLLTLLDLPRPEVLLNVFSMQDSSPSGRELATESELIRSAVSTHNQALQNAIEYGWAYLSRQMQNPGYFDTDFANYLTQRFVSEPPECAAKPGGPQCVSQEQRDLWNLCPAGSYCLGYTEAFKPLKPTLSNILLGLIAAKDPFREVFTTIGCMEGKFEVYGKTCFPERDAIATLPGTSGLALSSENPPGHDLPADPKQCLAKARGSFIDELKLKSEPSCEDLDLAGLDAQFKCHVPVALPLGCFTVQAAKSFVPYNGFSTFTFRRLNGLAEEPIAKAEEHLPNNESSFSTTPLGLLRAATVNVLFNYKMAQQFPREFSPYSLSHSAQELNAEFNPLVVAFNQDVAAFTRNLMQKVQDRLYDSHWYTPWRGRNRSFVADGLITVRGISGVESLVDTETQSSFSVPQFQTPASVLGNLSNLAGGSSAAPNASTTTTSTSTVSGNTTSGSTTTAPTPQPSPPPPSANLLTLLPGGLAKASLPAALVAAISPTAAQAQIGRQLTLDVTPHTLPGASSAELEVKLWAQEDSPPTLYKDGGTSPQNDPISRVARHNVFTRVRVESVKLFEVSSFSALVQRPRTKFPLVPPFVQIPVINDLIGLPLPGAKVYYRSTAIVSAIIVATAADLAFGMEYASDRAATGEGRSLSFRRITSIDQLPWQQQKLYQYNQARADCFATFPQSAGGMTNNGPGCKGLTFDKLAPDR